MHMKRLLAAIAAVTVLAGCAADESREASETTSAETSAAVTSENTAATAAAPAETTASSATAAASTVITAFSAEAEEPPINAELGVNGDGTLSEVFTDRLAELAAPDEPVWAEIFPSLWDFDEDGVPEIILTYHNGGQGRMPSYVYDAESMEQIGEFDGFCRDGFTRFVNNGEGTVIYNYYEHSAHVRFESVEQVHIADGRLVSDSSIKRNWAQTSVGEHNARLKYWEGGSDTEERYERGFTNMVGEDYNYIGNVCTSFTNKDSGGVRKASETAVESYNNYIKFSSLKTDDLQKILIFGNKNQYAFLQRDDGCFFITDKGEMTLLKEGREYYDLYTLLGDNIGERDDIIVCQRFGNTAACDVYVMTDGKPELVSELSGKGMYFDYSHLYNGDFELIESVYDASTGGGHTFKRYQFYRDKDGFHESGSIEVPLEEFNKYYGEAAQKVLDEFQTEEEISGLEICEVLYREDRCFILNCRQPICSDDEENRFMGAYNYYNLTLKLAKEGFSFVNWDRGVYKTALIPEIAVYPEEMYITE